MYFTLNVIDRNQDARQFFFQIDELEMGFEFLNHIVDKGAILISVDLIDNDQCTSLPVKAFDGISFLPELEKLKNEWVSILAKPLQLKVPMDLKITHLYKEKLNFYEQRIISLELMISDINRHCAQTEAPFRTKNEVVSNRYQSVLRRYEAQLNQAHLVRKWLFSRFYNQ